MFARIQLTHDMQRLADKYKKLNTKVVRLDTVVFVPSKIAFFRFGQVFMYTDDIDPHICTVESLQVFTFVWSESRIYYLCQPARWFLLY